MSVLVQVALSVALRCTVLSHAMPLARACVLTVIGCSSARTHSDDAGMRKKNVYWCRSESAILR